MRTLPIRERLVGVGRATGEPEAGHSRRATVRVIVRGTAAGLVGVVAMVGVITTLRRWLLTSDELALSRTHPEKIAQRLADMAGSGTLEDRSRRRAGDILHYGYGALWGVALALCTRSRDVRVGRDGLALGLGLWVVGFNALLPSIGAHQGPWTWRRREFVLTLTAHAAYGLATAAVLRSLGPARSRKPTPIG